MLGKKALAAGVLLVLILVPLSGQEKPKPDAATIDGVPARVMGSPTYAVLNINNITSWMRYDGHSNRSPGSDDGMYFPRGKGSVVFQDCLVWGGKVFTDAGHQTAPTTHPIRIGGGTYSVGTRAGRVNGSGSSATAEDPNAADVRIYRIRRDFFTVWEGELALDAGAVLEVDPNTTTSTQWAQVRAQYATDWAQWPVSKGAPFIDRNGNGIYDPPPPFNHDPFDAVPDFTEDSLVSQGRDEPGIAGQDLNMPADQVIWTVYNDLHVSSAQSFEGSNPIGLEIQKTMWAYNKYNALRNTYFVRYRIINKGGIDTSDAMGDQFGSFWIDSMYVGHWSDPDIGNAGDDLVGSDIGRSMGFAYNGKDLDQEYALFQLAPPVVAYHFLAGPTVPAPGDSAMVNFRRVYGKRNVPLTSFGSWGGGEPYTSPPGGYLEYLRGSGRWWKMFRGFAPLGDFNTQDIPYASGPYPTSPYRFSGDPATGTGFIDGLGTAWSFPPGDRRILSTAGPFRMAPGDTQDVTLAVIGAVSSDRMSAFAVLRLYHKEIRSLFERGMKEPQPPAPPQVKVTELDREIVLSWGDDLAAVQRTEGPVTGDTYAFEGYAVYQLPSAGASLNDGVRLATFDRVNGIGKIVEQSADPWTGDLITRVVQEGNDTGIKRSLRVTRFRLDEYTEELLVNGREYYFAVTAYNLSGRSSDLPLSLTSAPVYLTAKPKIPFGLQTTTAIGDTLAVVHSSGFSDARVIPLIVDPLAGRGDTFQVTFRRASGVNVTWDLVNRSNGTLIAGGQGNLSGDETYPIVDGAIVKVFGVEAGLKAGAWGLGDGSSFNTGARNMSWANGDGLAFEEFNGAAGARSPSEYFTGLPMSVTPTMLKGIVIKFTKHTAANASANKGADLFDQTDDDSASYAYRYVRGATSVPARPEFGAWIVNTAGGYRFQDYRISAPLTAYNTDVNPPARLAIAYSENNSINAELDGYYYPGNQGSMRGGDNNTSTTGPREWLYILDSPYTGAAPNGAWADLLNDSSIPVMYWFTWNRRNDNAWVGNESVTFTPNRMPDSTDTFTFVVPAPTRSRALELASADRIGVFPNPYYAEGGTGGLMVYTKRPSVTFTNLPSRATIRIFNLAGHLVRTLRKDSPTQFLEWTLQNEDGWLVASGMYICHIELPDLGVSKVIKLGVIAGL